MPALPLTLEQKEDAARLKKLFLAWKTGRKARGEPASQDAFSDLVGITQSAVSQYLNGAIPLNPAAAAKFSKVLGCQISEFSASVANLASEIGEAATPATSSESPPRMDITELSRAEAQLVLTFRELPESARDQLSAFAGQLRQESAARTLRTPPALKQAPVKRPRRVAEPVDH